MKVSVEGVGPWPLGQDTVSTPTSSVFQQPSRRDGPSPRLRRAYNVDIDADGWVRMRDGVTQKLAGTAIARGFYGGGVLLLQDGAGLYKVTEGEAYSTDELASGLSGADIEFHEWDFETVLWMDDGSTGMVYQGDAYPWGLTVPAAPLLSAQAGSLSAGTYRVVCTLEDALGREHGATPVGEITISASQDIVVDLDSPDASATYANIYVSSGDNRESLLWCQRVAIGNLPATVSDVRVSRAPCRTQYLRGPIPGNGVSEVNGYVLTWVDTFVFRSEGQTPHLFDPTNVMSFEHEVRAVAAPDNSGFYVATAGGLYWVATGASEPKDWNATKINNKCYAKGFCVESTDRVSVSDADTKVVLLIDQDGLVACLPNSQVRHVTNRRMRVDTTNATVRFAYRDRGEGVNQLLIAVN